MLKINNNFKKYRIPLIATSALLSGIFLFQYLTFIPEYSGAEEINTPVYDENKKDTRTLSQIDTMQEMTTGICRRSANLETKQLEDIRINNDGKTRTYWVTKLVGNAGDDNSECWMTQNLDLDIPDDGLRAKDTNITSNWLPIDSPTSSTPWTVNSNNTIKYYDAGWYVYTTPTAINNSCNATSLSACTNKGWTNVSDKIASNEPEFSTNSDIIQGNEYDAHYLIGNYYSWTAATAGKGNDTVVADGANINDSICPRGWKLPAGNNVAERSFSSLASAYRAYSNATGSSILRSKPLYFLYSGGIGSGTINAIGGEGNYWSSTAYYARQAYLLKAGETFVYSSNIGDRYYGRSVRCVNRDDVPDVKIPEIDNPNVSVTVDKILTMKLDSKEVNIEPKTNEIMTGNFTATVSSNAGYDIGLSTTEDSSTALVNKEDDIVIAEIPASNNIQVGNNGWGIKCMNDEGCILKTYNALTLYNNPQVYFSSTNAVTNKPTHFEVGIGISPSLPSGTYSTNILVTASQK